MLLHLAPASSASLVRSLAALGLADDLLWAWSAMRAAGVEPSSSWWISVQARGGLLVQLVVDSRLSSSVEEEGQGGATWSTARGVV